MRVYNVYYRIAETNVYNNYMGKIKAAHGCEYVTVSGTGVGYCSGLIL